MESVWIMKRFYIGSCLLLLIEKLRELLDQNGAYGAQLTDLPKNLDSLPQELIIAKFHVYEVNMAYTRAN